MIHSEKKEADCRVAPYVPERKLWCGFSGKRWEPDVGGLKAMELSKSLADELMVYALNIGDGQTRKEYIDQWKSDRCAGDLLSISFELICCYLRQWAKQFVTRI